MEDVFGDRRQRPVHAERATAMAHGVELEIAKGDLLHLAIGRMIVDPVLVAPKTVARVQHRRMLVGGARELVEPAAGQFAEPIEMRLQLPKIVRRKIERQQVAQPAVDGIEIFAGAVEPEMIGTLRLWRLLCRAIAEREARAC